MSLQQLTDRLAGLQLSPEERLLLLCARLNLDQNQQEELEALVQNPLDWDEVLHITRWHQLAPLVFHHLRGLDVSHIIPPELMEQVKAAYQNNVVRNLYFQGELQAVLDALASQEIPVVVLKGAALSSMVYQDIGLRPMSDLDLLATEDQVYAAQQAILDLGFYPIGDPEEQLDTAKHHRHLPGLRREGSVILVEVHRHIVRQDSGLHFDISEFWSRSETATVAKREARVLAPEDLLIHLTLNFFLDRRFRSAAALRQLCDVAEALRFYQDRIRWQLFLENVREYRLAGPVGCVLYLAQELLDAPVNRDVSEELWPRGFNVSRMNGFIRRRVLGTRDWIGHSLVAPDLDYRAGRLALATLRRLVSRRRYLERQDESAVAGVQGGFRYLSRLGEGIRILLRAALRPGETREDLALDRWHHSLYGYQNGVRSKSGGPDRN